MSKFAHNKSTANVSLIDGKIFIPIGGKEPITETQASHEDTVHAVRMGWVTIEGDKSSTINPSSKAGIEFTKDPMQGSTTIPVVKSKVAATSTSIGSTDKEEVEAPAKTTRKTKAKAE